MPPQIVKLPSFAPPILALFLLLQQQQQKWSAALGAAPARRRRRVAVARNHVRHSPPAHQHEATSVHTANSAPFSLRSTWIGPAACGVCAEARRCSILQEEPSIAIGQ
ncbi:unnamed protein product, partial [Pylaiella littoralis]